MDVLLEANIIPFPYLKKNNNKNKRKRHYGSRLKQKEVYAD